MIRVIGRESSPAFARSSAYAVSIASTALASPNSPMKEARMRSLRVGDGLEDGADLVDRLVLVASDLELDERAMPVHRDLTCMAGIERRADVLNVRHLREARDDVLDRGPEGGIVRSKRAALDQDALAGGLLEAGVEDPIHAARLAGPGRVRVDVLRPDHAAEGEGDDDEGEPAERGGLPVTGAPATHAGREVAVRGAKHSPSSFTLIVGSRSPYAA
jgi:hypothetical protein